MKTIDLDVLYEEYMKAIGPRWTNIAPLVDNSNNIFVDDYNNLSKEEYERQKDEMIKSSKLYEKRERW